MMQMAITNEVSHLNCTVHAVLVHVSVITSTSRYSNALLPHPLIYIFSRHFDSFDFSTLYTNIPHDLLLDSISQLSEAYRIRGAKYLVVQGDGTAYWSNTVLTREHSITEDQLVKLIKFLVDNIYIQVGNKIFRQTIGIPMGTDCAPLLANLFLFYYEYNFMKEKLKHNSQIAKIFSNTFRYIDDLLTLNNPTFEQEIRNIYPRQLELKRTTETDSI